MKVRAQWDNSGEIIFERDLADSDLLDCNIYAAEVADMCQTELDNSGRVPLGCGDFTITLADDPDSVICWTSQSYFFGG